jgi:hypothetical protein
MAVAVAVAFSVGVCEKSRWAWWFLVAVNALAFAAAPFFFQDWWISLPLSVVALACLLAPESRRYVLSQPND